MFRRSSSSTSIDELLQKDHTLLEPPLTLQVCLRDLFHKGWDPNFCGMHKLLEEAIVWLKSVEKGPLKHEDFPADLQSLLVDFANLTKSASDLERLKDRQRMVMTAARSNVEQRVKEATLQCERLPNGHDVLEKRKATLAAWLKKQEDTLKEELDNMELHHSSVRTVFETKLNAVIQWSFREWQQMPTPPELLQSDDQLMQDLDAELQALLLRSPAKPEPKESLTPAAMEVDSGIKHPEVEPEPQPVARSADPTSKAEEKKSNGPEDPTSKPPTSETGEKKGNGPEDPTSKPPTSEPGEKKGNGPEDPTLEPGEKLQEKTVVKRVIVPKGAETKITHNKVNIFDREVCKKIQWSATSPEATPEVPTAEGGQQHDTGLAKAEALGKEFKRQDTSDLTVANADNAVIVDGITYFKKKNGELETLEQRDARLYHNSYMRFSRAMTGPRLGFGGLRVYSPKQDQHMGSQNHICPRRTST